MGLHIFYQALFFCQTQVNCYRGVMVISGIVGRLPPIQQYIYILMLAGNSQVYGQSIHTCISCKWQMVVGHVGGMNHHSMGAYRMPPFPLPQILPFLSIILCVCVRTGRVKLVKENIPCYMLCNYLNPNFSGVHVGIHILIPH